MATPPICTAVALEHGRGADRAAAIVASLGECGCFAPSIVACFPRSAWVAGSPQAGLLPAVNLGVAVTMARDGASGSHACAGIADALGSDLPPGSAPETGSIEGRGYRIAAKRSSCFDLIVVPHDVASATSAGLRLSEFERQIAAAVPAPTVFCRGVPKWRAVIIADPAGTASWWASQVLARLGPSSTVAVQKWAPAATTGRALLPPDRQAWGPQSTAGRVACVDVAAISAEQQASACLVVPARALRATFRFRRLRGVLRRWRGRCLVLP